VEDLTCAVEESTARGRLVREEASGLRQVPVSRRWTRTAPPVVVEHAGRGQSTVPSYPNDIPWEESWREVVPLVSVGAEPVGSASVVADT
jgi:hypothetical protein